VILPYPTAMHLWHGCALRLAEQSLLQRRQLSPADRYGVWRMEVPQDDVKHALKNDEEWNAIAS
jgi:hypothetical protein